ncbi:hypothetical protein K438DRAFT_2073087 [Mycena galopus ATCC 62051]|nr:hypothetical protein K438DRAFT_2073087 [Mycena galopus ATCC 62051]
MASHSSTAATATPAMTSRLVIQCHSKETLPGGKATFLASNDTTLQPPGQRDQPLLASLGQQMASHSSATATVTPSMTSRPVIRCHSKETLPGGKVTFLASNDTSKTLGPSSAPGRHSSHSLCPSYLLPSSPEINVTLTTLEQSSPASWPERSATQMVSHSSTTATVTPSMMVSRCCSKETLPERKATLLASNDTSETLKNSMTATVTHSMTSRPVI